MFIGIFQKLQEQFVDCEGIFDQCSFVYTGQRLHSPFFLADICVKSESNPICLRHICVKKYQKARIRNISRFATNTRIHDSDNPFHTNGRFYMTEVFE